MERIQTGRLTQALLKSDGSTSIYSSIDSTKEIRLLNLQPAPSPRGEDDTVLAAPVICTLTTALRQSESPYKALSYTWGNDYTAEDFICPNCGAYAEDTCARCSPCPQIECNGHPLAVTRNCLNALLTLRQCRIFGPIWIDAICINQHDVEERNAQVGLIGDVFRNAVEVVVCLCEEQLGMTAPVAPLPALEIFPERGGQRFAEVDRTELEFRTSRHRKSGTSLLTPEMFYRSPWFTRTWIVQEVMLARSLVVIPEFGRRPVLWNDLGGMYGIWSEQSFSWDIPEIVRLKQRDHDVHSRASNVLSSFNVGTGMEYKRLFEVLEMTRHFQCQEPVDKLFAVLPLFAKPTPSILSADYSKSAVIVFRDLTWFLLLSNQPEILSLASLNGRGAEKPSWVVDWSDGTPQASRLELGHRPSKWSAGCWPNFRHIYVLRKSDNVLIVRGRILDDVNAAACTHLHTRQYPAKANDKVCVFLGFRMLFLLRPYGTAFQLVDECAVEGLMNGEALSRINPSRAYDREPPRGLIDFEIH